MASITLTGTLLDPTGEVAVGDQIRFTHRTTTGETIQFARSLLIIPPNGMYNFTLEFGLIFVEYLDVKDVNYKNLGVVTVNGDTTATDLPALLNSIVPPTDAQLLLFQAILQDTEDARDIALAAAAQQTTLELIFSTVIHPAGTVLTLSGYTLSGNGGGAQWKLNGTVGQPVSQSPAQLGDALLNDASGNQWRLVPIAGTATIEINAPSLGALFNDVADDRLPLQAAFTAAAKVALKPLGGAKVIMPKGIARTSGPLEVDSDVGLFGAGKTLTRIKPLDSATFAANEAVIQTTDFPAVQGTNLWDYYAPYPNGLVMGLTVRDLTIDGNRANVANAGGLNVYGGKWDFQNIGVINCDSHCIWTEAGLPISSTSGDDYEDFLNMHESYASNIYICNSNKHGWFYRGPNDSAISDLQVKTCKWGGFFQESTGNNSVGNLELSMHAYSCNCQHDADGAMITLRTCHAQFLYVDASARNGLLTTGACIIDEIIVLGNNPANAGNFWGVKLGVATQINLIRNAELDRTSGTDGGLLQINAESCVVSQIRTVQASGTTIAQKAIEINAPCNITKAVVEGYTSAGSVGVDISSDRVSIDVQAKNNLVAIDYNVSGQNKIKLTGKSNTADINFAVPRATDDIIEQLSDKTALSSYRVGKVFYRGINEAVLTASFAASFTHDMLEGSYVKIDALTAAIAINKPTNIATGDIITYQMQQDGTGGFAVTFDSDHKTNYSNTSNAAFTRHTIRFKFDGLFLIQQGAPSGWF